MSKQCRLLLGRRILARFIVFVFLFFFLLGVPSSRMCFYLDCFFTVVKRHRIYRLRRFYVCGSLCSHASITAVLPPGSFHLAKLSSPPVEQWVPDSDSHSPPLTPAIPFPSPVNLPVPDNVIRKWIVQCLSFYVWFVSAHRVSSVSIHVIMHVRIPFLS